MPASKFTYDPFPNTPASVLKEGDIESGFIGRLQRLKYTYRLDITESFQNRRPKIGSRLSLAGNQKRLFMRPYQVYAVQFMVKRIDDDNGNGFVWHATGSGKTLTSFKASTLLKENDSIHTCVFVVDRKDLDRQTREEFNRFQEGCVKENTNTAAIVLR
jgi:type I site-specific restriction endonuclease